MINETWPIFDDDDSGAISVQERRGRDCQSCLFNKSGWVFGVAKRHFHDTERSGNLEIDMSRFVSVLGFSQKVFGFFIRRVAGAEQRGKLVFHLCVTRSLGFLSAEGCLDEEPSERLHDGSDLGMVFMKFW